MNAAEQFRAAIRKAGINPPDAIIADGKLHRFPTNGTKNDDSGWYSLHSDGVPAGVFGCWRSDISRTWRAAIGRKLTPAEETAHRERIAQANQAREAEEKRRRAVAAEKASRLWDAAVAVNGHAYVKRKGIAPT